jgi:endonuclease G, mitochondrial
MGKKKAVANTLPDTPLRVTSVLKSRAVRDEIADLAKSGLWSTTSELNAGAERVSDLLTTEPNASAETDFFDTRRFSEAIVLAKGRPVLLVRKGIFEEAPLNELEKSLKPHRTSLVKPISAIGRIELMDHDSMEWCGTGWRVEDDYIITNRHVANIFAQRQGTKFLFRLNQLGRSVRARIDFREEYRQPESEEHPIAEVLWVAQDIAEAPDLAILRIKVDAGLPPPLAIAGKDATPDDLVAVVGYPAKDSRNDAGLMQSIFGDIYDVKRFAPGHVNTVPKDAWYLTHDCTTLGGNSGSAVLGVDSGKVVGLHFGGQFRKANYAVKASVVRGILRRRSWVPVSSVEFAIPEEGFSEKKRTVTYMKDRAGFDENFLGVTARMPKPGSSHSLLKIDGAPKIDYTHYSVVMSETRRLPIITAVNINGELKKSLKRKDAWGFDPRVAKEHQLGHTEFYGPQAFDKGHMVRREDPGWGDTLEEALLGEEDTFVYTNAVPQMPQLNQRSWLSLEDYVLQNAKTHGFKVSVFTGPVLRANDPEYGDIPVPVDFWKVIAMIDADTEDLLVSAYMLSQEGMMPTEGFRYGPFKTYQVPLAKVANEADIKFAASMTKADVFAGIDTDESMQFGRFIEIVDAEDVVLTRAKT